MNELQAIILGIVQGLTEFLPISSTAHLYIVPALLGWEDPSTAFVAVIQLGTLVAVLAYFWRDIVHMTKAFVRGIVSRKPFAEQDSRLAWLIVLGTLPVVVLGLAFSHDIETTLRNVYVYSAAMIVVALLMVAAEELVKIRRQSRSPEKPLERLTWLDSLLVGFCQACALVPGTSRSGSTITGSLFLGLSRESAARFSFLLSLPAVFAAGMLQLYKAREKLLASQSTAANLVLATVVSGVVGYAAIAFLLRYLKTHTLHLFVVYRLALAALLLGLVMAGKLSPDVKPSEDSGKSAHVSTDENTLAGNAGH